jgi:hypothetical protein
MPRRSTAPGLHDPQLDGLLRIGIARERLGDEAQGDLGPAQCALAVGQHGAVALVTAHPPIGT